MTQWEDITRAVGLALGGEKERGREALADCWTGTTEVDHAQRCVTAHYLADLQTSLEDEVAWDEAAMDEFAHVSDEDLAPVGITSAAAMAPRQSFSGSAPSSGSEPSPRPRSGIGPPASR